MFRIIFLAILLYSFWNVNIGSLIFILLSSIVNLYLILTVLVFKPRLNTDWKKWSHKEIEIINRYRVFFCYPLASQSFSSSIASIYIFGLMLSLWLLLNGLWVQTVLVITNVFFAGGLRSRLNPVRIFHYAVEKQHKLQYLEEMNDVDSVVRKMSEEGKTI